ncbi:hypothetical protein DBT52_09425 [Aerococcus mictus]|nr:hypothetical protein DBT52_09425 [Aerococcus mictus]
MLPNPLIGPGVNAGLGFCKGDILPELNIQLVKAQYKATFDELRGHLEGWSVRFEDGIQGPGRVVTIGGDQYEFYSSCKPHDCGAKSLRVLTSIGGAAAWAMSLDSDRGTIRFYGKLDPAKQAVLLGNPY